MVNLANPGAALKWWRLPAAGIGLARMEFIIGEHIGAHPMALAHPDRIDDPRSERAIDELTGHHSSPAEYFVDRLASGIAALAATWADRPVIVRMSDFKTNEYAGLLGGEQFEPTEDNPMLGWRGRLPLRPPRLSRRVRLECQAVARVRNEIGFDNVIVMIPFCRTPAEADRVLAGHGRGGAGARRQRAEGVRDGRDPLERHQGRRICRALRRVLHRLQRPHTTHPGRRPRLRRAGGALRRATTRRCSPHLDS
jgi:phosphoenolpyruvate synthase/pyruvate phosphate dikinase